jgi:hypothetical protein
VRIVKALMHGETYDIHTDIETVKRIAAQAFLGPSTNAIVEEAKKEIFQYINLIICL